MHLGRVTVFRSLLVNPSSRKILLYLAKILNVVGEEFGIWVWFGLPPAQVPEAQAARDGGAAQVAARQVQADPHPCKGTTKC